MAWTGWPSPSPCLTGFLCLQVEEVHVVSPPVLSTGSANYIPGTSRSSFHWHEGDLTQLLSSTSTPGGTVYTASRLLHVPGPTPPCSSCPGWGGLCRNSDGAKGNGIRVRLPYVLTQPSYKPLRESAHKKNIVSDNPADGPKTAGASPNNERGGKTSAVKPRASYPFTVVSSLLGAGWEREGER